MNYLIKLFVAPLVIFTLSFNNAVAQDYKPVEVDLGIRGGSLLENGEGGTLGLFLEPRYNINNKASLGLRIGFDVIAETLENAGATTDVTLQPSYFLTGDYMLVNHKNKRVFAGLGIGVSDRSTLKLIDIDQENPEELELGSSFGFVPRIGVKLGVFKLSVDYSIYAKENVNDFLGINVGFSFGGGRRR